MRIGAVELTKDKMIAAVAVIVCALLLIVYVIFYSPLIAKISQAASRCRTLETDVADVRYIINTAGEDGKERILASEDRVAEAISELTDKGSKEGVNFVFINPKDVEVLPDLKYKVLPIRMRLESSYKQLGTFLGSLDEFEKGLLRVRSFVISTPDGGGKGLLTDLTVDMYLPNIDDE